MTHNRYFATFTFLVLMTSAEFVVQAQTPVAKDLLSAMMRAEGSIQYSGTQTITQGPLTIKTRVWRSGAKRRIEYLEPAVRRGDLLVNNGTDVWLYHRKENTAVQTKAMPRQWQQLRRSRQAKILGTQNVAGRPAWVVSVSGPDGMTRKMWIDKANKARLRSERYARNGARVSTDILRTVSFNPIPVSRFQWTPPAGAQVTRTSGRLYMNFAQAQQAANWQQYPHELPAGYVFESAVVDPAKGEAWLRYSNGIKRFSIFQQRATNGREIGLTQVKGQAAWFWQRGGYRFLAVDIPAAQVSSVTASVK